MGTRPAALRLRPRGLLRRAGEALDLKGLVPVPDLEARIGWVVRTVAPPPRAYAEEVLARGLWEPPEKGR
jgi:hypothetical protein